MTINWSRLATADGSAGQVPDLLRALEFGDGEISRSACKKLISILVPQGVLFEAAPFAALDLIAQLQRLTGVNKALAFRLLEYIVSGEGRAEDLVEWSGKMVRVEALCHVVIEANLELFAEAFDDQSEGVAAAAAGLVSSFTARHVDALSLLKAAADKASTPDATKVFLGAVNDIQELNDPVPEVLTRIPEDGSVRVPPEQLARRAAIKADRRTRIADSGSVAPGTRRAFWRIREKAVSAISRMLNIDDQR